MQPAALQSHSPAAPQFPICYAMRFTGHSACGVYNEGDLLAINTLAQPEPGDVVCVHYRQGGAVMMTLDMPLAPGTFDRMPWAPRHADEPVPVISGAGLAGGYMMIKATDIWAVHLCDGLYEPDVDAVAA